MKKIVFAAAAAGLISLAACSGGTDEVNNTDAMMANMDMGADNMDMMMDNTTNMTDPMMMDNSMDNNSMMMSNDTDAM